jgi:hypothetical protein
MPEGCERGTRVKAARVRLAQKNGVRHIHSKQVSPTGLLICGSVALKKASVH